MAGQFQPTSNARPFGAAGIASALRAQIAAGTYRSGAVLPSTRRLAAEFGVSRTTVTAAYDQLAAEGYIETRPGAAARVADGVRQVSDADAAAAPQPACASKLSVYAERALDFAALIPHAAEQAPIDFRYGDMSGADFPRIAWRRAIGAAALRPATRMVYADPAGLPELREALQAYLWRARGLRCDADQIIIVNGSQQAIDLCVRLFVDQGDKVVIEDPGYPAARQAIAAAGAELLAVEADHDGLRTELLCGEAKVRAAFVTPSHQFPLGGVLPIARRRELLDWAERVGAMVVEDDYDGEYRYGSKPIEALASLDGFRSVVYVGTLSKTLSPRMRLGYLVAPKALAPAFAAVKRLADRHSPTLEQAALADFIASGAYERHVRRVRRRNGERREALLAALRHEFGDRVAVQGDAAGLHLVVWVPELVRSREAELVAATRRLGVGIQGVSPLYVGTPEDGRPTGLVLGYAPLEPAQIAKGVRALREALDGLPPKALTPPPAPEGSLPETPDRR